MTGLAIRSDRHRLLRQLHMIYQLTASKHATAISLTCGLLFWYPVMMSVDLVNGRLSWPGEQCIRKPFFCLICHGVVRASYHELLRKIQKHRVSEGMRVGASYQMACGKAPRCLFNTHEAAAVPSRDKCKLTSVQRI